MPDEIDVFNIDELNRKLTVDQRCERQKDIDDLRKILKTPEGRRFTWRHLGRCRIFCNSFNPNSNQTAFNEGQRSIGLVLLGEVNEANMTAFSKMQNEYLSALYSKKQNKEAKDA